MIARRTKITLFSRGQLYETPYQKTWTQLSEYVEKCLINPNDRKSQLKWLSNLLESMNTEIFKLNMRFIFYLYFLQINVSKINL